MNGTASDTIVDCEAARASKDIILRRMTEFLRYDDLFVNQMVPNSESIVIGDRAGLTITLLNVVIAELKAAYFIF